MTSTNTPTLPALDSPEINRMTGFDPAVAAAHQAGTESFARDMDDRVAEIGGIDLEALAANEAAVARQADNHDRRVKWGKRAAATLLVGGFVLGAANWGMENDPVTQKIKSQMDRAQADE